MHEVLGLLAIFGYSVMQFIELAAVGSRIAGKISSNLALGTTIHQTMYIGSRFFLVPFLPVLAYLVETGITINDYLLLVIISLFAALLISVLVLYKVNYFQIFFQIVFKNNVKSHLPISLFNALIFFNKQKKEFVSCETFSKSEIINKKVVISFFAYSFLVTGFFIAFLLAIQFPEYQLTLSQSTAVFHGIGAVIIAFYLDPMLSRSIDRLDENTVWLRNAYSIILGRILSYLVACIFFICILFFTNIT